MLGVMAVGSVSCWDLLASCTTAELFLVDADAGRNPADA